jgi:hypothetical protein
VTTAGRGRTCGQGFFILPLGSTVVVGGIGRSDVLEDSFGAEVSFFGFFAILLLRCSPLGMEASLEVELPM